MVTRVACGARLAGLSEAVLGVGAAALGLGDGAGEGPRAGAHLDGSVAGGAHVGVHAHAAVHVHGQARRALAAEGALRVDAAPVHADPRRLALINICEGDRHGSVLLSVNRGHQSVHWAKQGAHQTQLSMLTSIQTGTIKRYRYVADGLSTMQVYCGLL